MTSIINKNDSIGKVEKILQNHHIGTPFGWEIVFGMLLDECENYIEVHDIGEKAYFTQV